MIKSDNLKVMNKRAQQTMGMPFGVIFSIILIVVFLVVAGIVVKHFLGLQKCSQISIFLKDLQDETDKVWKSSSSEKSVSLNLPGAIEEVCFTNFSMSVTQKYSDVKTRYGFYNQNFFFYPPEKACEVPYYNIEHINITGLLGSQNPYCIKNDGKEKIILSKGFYENLVRIKKG